MSDLAFEGKSASFLDWFKAWPGASFHEDIEIRDLRNSGRGRGIVAKADIPEDTVLFTIPRAAIINTQTSELAKKLPVAFAPTVTDDTDNEADDDGGENGPPDNWVSLILVMIYEYLQGDNSRWKRYFDVLPTDFDTLMWWSDAELDWLQASSIVHKIGKDDAESMFRARILPIVEKNADVFYPNGAQKLSEDALISLAHRIGSTIMAYAFDLENDDDGADQEEEDEWVEDREGKILMGMVPMADILNADAEFNAHVNHEEDSLTVTAIRPIAAGQEILNYYGPLGNGELLRRYGYTSVHHARYDVVEIPWNLVVSALKQVLVVDNTIWGEASAQFEPEDFEDAFVIDRDLDEPDSRGEYHGPKTLKSLPEDLREQINTILKAIRKLSPETIPDKQRRDEICLSAMGRAFQLKLAEYPTSTADDEKLLSSNTVLGHPGMALFVRYGEKLILQEAISLVSEKINGSIASQEEDNQPSAKRIRTK
ncbi:SET domain-containing protein [Xylaria bambusicola]|uniref:SET domain-containing protein n=1 Tax=Xylaria bambusicola TaxID=326684 RepID=UPI0020075C79|nr:SET domain-containing protein [Xylaria bambusicola]KAI0508922.1 SET domain-containing protein [Xylaria bambusicola]